MLCISEEKRPLIPKESKYIDTEDSWFLFILLACAVMCGGYLLYNQNRITISSFFDLVHRDVWGADETMNRGELLDKTVVSNVIIAQTNGPPCDTFSGCVRFLLKLQADANRTTGQDIPYNFLIGGDGQTYEARGWSFQSGVVAIPRNTSLTVAFIGDYSLEAPHKVQMRQAQALIVEAISCGRLQRGYKVYGARNETVSETAGGALFTEIARRWTRWMDVIPFK